MGATATARFLRPHPQDGGGHGKESCGNGGRHKDGSWIGGKHTGGGGGGAQPHPPKIIKIFIYYM